MDEKKQIEEMACEACLHYRACLVNGEYVPTPCAVYEDKAGYRKQSDGEWLPSPDGINPIRCNKCNMPAPFVAGEDEFGDFGFHRYHWKFCPHCGAKMKGGAE